MDKVPSAESFDKLSGCPFGNFHGDPGLGSGDFALANGCNGGVTGEMNVHSTPYATSALDEMLEEAKSMEAQEAPNPQQYASSSVSFHPDLAKSYDPLGLSQSILQCEEKAAHDMPILPWEIAAGKSSELAAVPRDLVSNDFGTGGPLPTSAPVLTVKENMKRATGGRNGNSALSIEEKKQLRASRNREYAKQSRLRAKKKHESLEASVLEHRKKNMNLKATLDNYYEVVKVMKERNKGTNCKDKGINGISVEEAVEIAEETMKKCPWTYKKGTGSAIEIKKRKNN